MNTYLVRYIEGPQERLCAFAGETVQARSIDEALAAKSAWPVERNWTETSAWSKNPGTSLYYIEAWEATLVS